MLDAGEPAKNCFQSLITPEGKGLNGVQALPLLNAGRCRSDHLDLANQLAGAAAFPRGGTFPCFGLVPLGGALRVKWSCDTSCWICFATSSRLPHTPEA
jgi:hypothetical protein